MFKYKMFVWITPTETRGRHDDVLWVSIDL